MNRRDILDAQGSRERSCLDQIPGSTLVYEDEEGNVYRVEFTEETVSWECTSGRFVGDRGAADFCATATDQDTLVIAWSETSGEAVTLIASLPARKATICHVYDSECNFVAADLRHWHSDSHEHT